MTTDQVPEPHMREILADSPSNWGRWGDNDELGAINFLDNTEVLRGAAEIQRGATFTLGTRLGDPIGDPVAPDRTGSHRVNTRDKSSYEAGKVEPFYGGLEFADDLVVMYLQGTTHTDALGHAWYDNEIYNGYPASSTVQSMEKASILPIAQHGVIGRGVLLDVARYRGKDHLDRAESFTLIDLLDTAKSQGLEIQPHDVLLVRTGWLPSFFNGNQDAFRQEPFIEPGLEFEPAVAEWFHRMEIPAYCTDTITNELTLQANSGVNSILHGALMRNLGIVFKEMLDLDALATDCAEDGRYAFLFVSAPLKVVGGTGAPMNPVAIK